MSDEQAPAAPDPNAKVLVDQDPYPWARRRRFLYVVNLFCASVIVYILVKNRTGSVAETAITMAFFVLASSVASYVFGAVWQDVKHIAATGGAGYTRLSSLGSGRTSARDYMAQARGASPRDADIG